MTEQRKMAEVRSSVYITTFKLCLYNTKIVPPTLVPPKTSRLRVGKRQVFISKVFVFQSNHYTYWSPPSQEVAVHHLLMGSREFFFFFLCLSFIFLNCLYLNPWVFNFIFSPCSAEEQEQESSLVGTQQPAKVNSLWYSFSF